MDANQLILQAQGIARCLSYNESREAPAKHTLHELSHALGRRAVKIRRRKGKLIVVTEMGQHRELTRLEIILYKLFNVIPPIDGWEKKEHKAT